MAREKAVKLSQQLCKSIVCIEEMGLNPLQLHAGALDEAAGQQLTQQGIPAFAMFDAQGGSIGLPTGVLELLYEHAMGMSSRPALCEPRAQAAVFSGLLLLVHAWT